MKKSFIIIGVVLALIAAILILGAASIGTSAKSDVSINDACYQSYEIRPEDTLWGIAERFAPQFSMSTQDYLSELKSVNRLTGDRIFAGEKLIVFYRADSPVMAADR